MPVSPMRIESTVRQTRSYEEASTLTQASAASAAASRTAALPVSVRRKVRNGVSRLRDHAVRLGAAVLTAASRCSCATSLPLDSLLRGTADVEALFQSGRRDQEQARRAARRAGSS